MIAWFLASPIGRWAAGIWATIALVAAIYWSGRRKGAEALRQEQEAERNRRMRNVVKADDDLRRDVASGRLRESDGHRRD